MTSGRSILEIVWEHLDDTMEVLMSPAPPRRDIAGMPDLDAAIVAKGKAQGLAIAIAIIQNPYNIDIDPIREEALSRYWERRNSD